MESLPGFLSFNSLTKACPSMCVCVCVCVCVSTAGSARGDCRKVAHLKGRAGGQEETKGHIGGGGGGGGGEGVQGSSDISEIASSAHSHSYTQL